MGRAKIACHGTYGKRLVERAGFQAERGDDIEEVLNEWAEYEALVESKGLIATDFRSSELETLAQEDDEEDIEEKYFYDKDKKKKKKKKS